MDMINILTVFILAIFIGFEIITKVPPTLHTPLMSGSNAISGIAIVGAIIATKIGGEIGTWLGLIACLLYTSDAADEHLLIDAGGRHLTKKKRNSLPRTEGRRVVRHSRSHR